MMTATMNCIFGLTVILLSHAFPDFSQDLAPDKVNCSLPNTLYVEVTSANQSLVLRLEKNPDVDPNAAIFLLNREAVLLKHRLQYSHNRAEYQDREHMATVEVTCTDNEDGNSTLSLRGLISMPDRRLYTLEPSRRFSRDETRTNEDLHNVIDRFWLDYAVLDHITDIPPANPPCPQPDAATPGAAPDVLLDIVVFVDHTVYQRWYNKSKRSTPEKKRLDTIENIRRHFGHLMNAVDLRFKMASPRFHAHLAGFVIETAGPGDRSREVPDPQTRTEVEGRWLLDSAWTLVSRTPGFPPNDHVIVFTESALFTTQEGIYTDVLGISYNGRMCHPYGYSISVTRYQDRLVDDVIAAAHEIGHSLGAQHDGISNSCSASENYIMSGTHAAEAHVTQNNQYIFSECSVRSFQKHVALLEARGDGKTLSCLYETIHPGPASFLLPAPGQTHDVHRQCQMIYSPSSFFCHIDIGGSENVCRRMPCYNPRTRRCSHHRARDGTTCGNRKWCVAGSCVLSTDAPAKQADCVFGNRPGPVYQGQDCGQTLGSKRYLCYSQRNRQVCCDTCLKMATGPPGEYTCVACEGICCEYGNNYWNISSCSPEHCGEPGSQYSRLCCDTCQTAPATPGLQTSSSTTYTPFVKGTGGTQSTSSNKTTVDENTPSVRPTSPANVTEGSAQETSSFITGMYDAAVTASSSAVYSTTAEGSSTEPKFNISGIKTILSKSNVVETTSMVTKRTYESLIEARVKTSEHALTTEPSKTSITESAAEEASTPFLPAATTASSATSVTTNEPPKSTSKRFLNDSPADVLSVDNTGERGQAQVDMSLFGACASGEGLHGSTDLSCTAETTQTPTKCYDIAYYNRCCTACRVFHSNVTGCEFGDRDPSMCRTIDRLSCCDHRTHCCATCHEDTQPLMCGYGTGSRSPRHALLVVVLSLCILT